VCVCVCACLRYLLLHWRGKCMVCCHLKYLRQAFAWVSSTLCWILSCTLDVPALIENSTVYGTHTHQHVHTYMHTGVERAPCCTTCLPTLFACIQVGTVIVIFEYQRAVAKDTAKKRAEHADRQALLESAQKEREVSRVSSSCILVGVWGMYA
jgi:hypothetical protein